MFEERASNLNTAGTENIKEATERLRRENEEKIRRMKEEKTGKKEADRKQKQEKYSQEFQRKPLHVEKIKPKGYTSQMRDEDLAYLDGWMQYEFGRFDWLMEELSIETQRRMDTAVGVENLKEIRKWHYESLEYTHKQFDNKKKEIWDLKKKVVDTFLYRVDPEEEKRKENETKFKSEFDVIYNGLYREIQYTNFVDLGIDDSSWIKRAREHTAILEKIKEGKFGSVSLHSWQERLKALEEYKKKIEAFFKEADEARKAKKGEGQSGPKKPDESGGAEGKKAEQIALQELGITFAEYKMITGNINNLNDGEIIRLITKVLQCSNEKSEIKNAYRRCAKDWHPDSGKTRFGIGVNEVKFKIANNLFGEYNRRFGK